MTQRGGVLRPMARVVLALGILATAAVRAGEMDPKAMEVLKAMSDHLAGSARFSVEADIDLEVVLRDAQKLQLSFSAALTVQRPDKLALRRRGGYADVTVVASGDTLLVYGKGLDAFASFPTAGTIDDAIRVYERETGIPAPGADLLFADPYAVLSEGVESAHYIGTAYVDGRKCHHLAFREGEKDWQLWVSADGAPFPV